MNEFDTDPRESKRRAQGAEQVQPEEAVLRSPAPAAGGDVPTVPLAVRPMPVPVHPVRPGRGAGVVLGVGIALCVTALCVLGVGGWLMLRAAERSHEAEEVARQEAEAREKEMAAREQAQANPKQLGEALHRPDLHPGAKKDWEPMFQHILPFIEDPERVFLVPGDKAAGEAPLSPKVKQLGELLNVQFRTVDPTLRRHLALAQGDGLVVRAVPNQWRADGPGDLRPHDVLEQLGGLPVKADDAGKLVDVVMKADAGVAAVVVREGRRTDLKAVPVLRKAPEPPRDKQ
jgi:hypothetical protein